jgi:hypothetical protein
VKKLNLNVVAQMAEDAKTEYIWFATDDEKLVNSKRIYVDFLGSLLDQVDRLSKDVSDLKSQMKSRQSSSVTSVHKQDSNNFRALDNHARYLIDLMIDRPGMYTTSELVGLLGLCTSMTIQTMRLTAAIDPVHVKLTQGKKRKFYLSYVPEGSVDPGTNSGNEDRLRLELMALSSGGNAGVPAPPTASAPHERESPRGFFLRAVRESAKVRLKMAFTGMLDVGWVGFQKAFKARRCLGWMNPLNTELRIGTRYGRSRRFWPQNTLQVFSGRLYRS